MWVIAAISWAEIIPTIIGLLGLSSLIFAALRYRRDDTTAVLNQQNTILTEMKTLNDELRTTTDSLRNERDQLKVQVTELTGQVETLTEELRRFGMKLDG